MPATENLPAPLFSLARSGAEGDTRRRFIAVAPNGGRKTKADHPTIPLTPDELALTARQCLEAGAGMIHLHVRDRQAAHVLDADLYRDATAAIRRAVGDEMIIQITTESLGRYQPADQRDIVRVVRPEAASFAFRELAPDAANASAFADIVRWMWAEGMMTQIIIYDTVDLDRVIAWAGAEGLPFSSLSVLYVLGRYGGDVRGMRQLIDFVTHPAPPMGDIMVCAFGVEELTCVLAAALMGANVRLGFENNLLDKMGSTASSNSVLIQQIASCLRASGFELSPAWQVRSYQQHELG